MSGLRLIHGESSPYNRFKSFVTDHSFEFDDPHEEIIRLGSYCLADEVQIVPIDSVEFKVMQMDGPVGYYININPELGGTSTYEVIYMDDAEETSFYDKHVEPMDDAEAMRLIDRLSAAEAEGNLRQST